MIIQPPQGNNSNSIGITGETKIYAGSTVPDGWLFCRGQTVSRTTYANLFSVIGTTYGSGDGSTTFAIPNVSGKVVAGYDSSQTEFNTLGKTGGGKTHQLTTGEMPSHQHSFTMRGHNVDNPGGYPYDGTSSATSTHTGYTDYTGGNGAHNNLQPYIVLNYIIKY